MVAPRTHGRDETTDMERAVAESRSANVRVYIEETYTFVEVVSTA